MTAIRIGIHCDREDWILGTIARQIIRVHGSATDLEFVLSSNQRFLTSPVRHVNEMRKCQIIHWLAPHEYLRYGLLFPNATQVCTINHVLPGDGIAPKPFEGARVLTISDYSRNELASRGFDEAAVIHTGVDTEIFKPLDKSYCRNALDIITGRPLIGFFAKASSNAQDRKGVQTLIEVVRILSDTMPVAILVSGEGWEDLSNDLEAAGGQVFHRRAASLEQMPLFYGAIDVYLCSSRVEGGPVPVLEAMACRRPVITTPVGHVPELISDGRNGITIPIDEPKKAAAAIEFVLSNSDVREAMSSAGRDTILSGWSWDEVVKPLSSIYRELHSEKPHQTMIRLATIKAYLLLLIRAAAHRTSSSRSEDI